MFRNVGNVAILLMQIFPGSIRLLGQELTTRPKMASLVHCLDRIFPHKELELALAK